MGKLQFYVLYSLREPPRQFISKSNRRCFQVHMPLPLPKQLVIFGLGEWPQESVITVEVVVSENVQAENIGTLTSQSHCLTWEGEWNSDLVAAAAERGRRGLYGKIVLKICSEEFEGTANVISSTPLAKKKRWSPEKLNTTDLPSTLHLSAENETVTSNTSYVDTSVGIADVEVIKIDTRAHCDVWPMDKTPRHTAIGKRGPLTWNSEDMANFTVDTDRDLIPVKRKLYKISTSEEMCVQIKRQRREVHPSKRWSHTMCLSDCDTAILIGGVTLNQNYNTDSLWKLELESDFWFQMSSSASAPTTTCVRGHTATYDPDSKAIFVYGGLRESQRNNELHILNTLTWKWRNVAAKGNVPNLAYHSAVFYKKELFVFGGVRLSHSSGDKTCTNALNIFNPEHELWYQPIVEGGKPLPRFGHSATLLSQKLIIFGGRTTATYLDDLYILDLGFMEYTAVKTANMPPLPRGFHAALPVGNNRILVSGGCSAVGALQDIQIFNIDTGMWSSVVSPLLCSMPRAGHSMIALDSTEHKSEEIQCTLLVFGGSDCCGSFYDDTIKCTVEISAKR